MGAGSSSSLPAAIVLSSVIVATGIYLGLRERAPVHSPTTAAEPAPLAPVVAPAPVVVDRALAGEHARAAVAYARPQLLARCYRPAIAGLPAPIPAEFVLDVTFDADGVQVLRGLNEVPGTSTPELTRCIGEQLGPLRIPAPGGPVQLEVPLRFP